jgi:hypothetical protein
MRWPRAGFALVLAAMLAWACEDAPVGPDSADTTDIEAITDSGAEAPMDLGPTFAQTPGIKGPTGALFTTTPDGSIVNENVRYEAKIEVYIDGGPPPNAPQTAAGLDDGLYVFQVTDPSGWALLSMDPAKCRIIRVQDGIIVELVAPSSLGTSYGGPYTDTYETGPAGKTVLACHIQDSPDGVAGPSARHDTNTDVDYGSAGAIVVQLMPFADTPNPGGVYKAWVTPIESYLARSGDLDENPEGNPVKGQAAKGCPDVCFENDPGFGPPRSEQKTDNFKVKEVPPRLQVFKFNDLDGDGVFDSGEPMITGWPITITETLFDGTKIDKSCVTPCDEHIAPNSTVKVTEDLPTGWTVSYLDVDGYLMTAAITVDVTFAPGEMYHAVTFGNWKESKKSGMKFHDLNANGKWDGGEPGLKDWTIFVDYNDNKTKDAGEPFAMTDANGDYTITGIKPGQFKIYEVLQKDWTCSFPNAGPSAAEIHPVTKVVTSSKCWYKETFTSGSEFEDNDFGNWKLASKSGKKWEDLDGDGVIGETNVYDGMDEMGLEDWTIYVDYNDNGKKDAGEPFDITDENGLYTITGIAPGEWYVREIVKKGDLVNGKLRDWYCSFPNAGAADKVDIDGAAGDQFLVFSSKCYYKEIFKSTEAKTGNDFGNWDDLYKSGKKFLDENKNGTYDDEPGMAGFTFYVDYNDNGQLDDQDGVNCSGPTCEPSAVSDVDGFYEIGMIHPGTWKIRELLQSGYVCVYPALSDAFGCYHLETFVSGIDQENNYFGNRPTEGCTPGYWKQEQHFDSWVGYVPNDELRFLFTAVQAEELYFLPMKQESGDPSVLLGAASLLQALQFPNDYGVGQLARHGVAAVLNAANPDVAFGYTVAWIVSAVDAALESGDSGRISALHMKLANANERGCPLN